jgi:inorganic diphosphatase
MVIEPNHKEWEKLVNGEEERGKLCLDRKYKA